jgi:deoxyribodipyrimidine photolyase-related protein
MPHEATLIYPHQLFADHPALAPGRPVWLIEDPLFTGSDPHQPIRFHQQKLVLHRASLRAYADHLHTAGYTVHLVAAAPGEASHHLLERILPARTRALFVADPVDHLLERRLRRFARTRSLDLHLLDTPMFLTPPDWFMPWCDGRKRYHMADFYIAQRKRLGLLLDHDGQPVGGRWSFDTDNRKRWPARHTAPAVYHPPANPHTTEAIHHVTRHHPDHPGRAAAFRYPVTHAEAAAALDHFLHHRFLGFGDYEDAIVRDEPFLHHSLLTPALNTGLLTPRQVIDRTLAHAAEHAIPLNDLEGFIRQIIGWREFMRIVYVREGTRQRTANFWNHQARLTPAWYDGTTGLDPLDLVIRRAHDHAYTHHIERLMVAGNAMLLCELHPDDVYRWFMELFIDAYDWVMVPNIYGMSQFADGGLITTKPYLSGSNYLKKMSDVPAGPWCDAWDGLYWQFIDQHRKYFARNPRLAVMAKSLDRMDPARRARLWTAADSARARLTTR